MTTTSSNTLPLEELDWLRTLATRLAASEDADDLVQETVLAAWKANPQTSPDRPLRPWLAAVARNRARMNARARTRREQRELASAVTPSAAARPDDELARLRALQAVSAALDELPELDRRIIIRRFVDEENATQIGERLGIPAATVRSRLRRSLAQLRASLDQRHRGWALALAGPLPRAEVMATGSGALGVKLGFGLTLGVGAAFAWSSCDREKDGDEQQAGVVAPAQAPVEPPQQQRELSERERWEQRRAQIRAALAERVGDEDREATAEFDDGELVALDANALEQARRDAVARARAGFMELRRACMEDLQSEASGAITISAVVIGDPLIGTIFDSVEIVTETVGDPEVIACVREAMYAYAGDPPPVPVESPFVVTMPWVGRDEDDTRAERRMFESVVGAHHGEIAACQRNAAFDGNATALVEFTITADMRAETRVVRTNLPDAPAECIVEAGQRWTFPKQLVDKMFHYEFQLPVEGLDRTFEK